MTTMTARIREEELAANGAVCPHQVTVRLSDGTVIRAERQHAKGSVADPFDDDDRLAKFFDCCASLDGAALTALYDRLQSLDEAADLGFLESVFV